MGTKKCVEWGFGYRESEYEVSFGLASRNGELTPSEPKTPEPFNSPFRARNPERSPDSNSAQNLGSVGQKLGSRGIYTQRYKRSVVKLDVFLTFEVVKLEFSFDLSIEIMRHSKLFN